MKKRIALLTGIPADQLQLPSAIRRLEKLGKSQIEFLPLYGQATTRRDLHLFDAVIIRPAWGGEINDESFSGLVESDKSEVVVGTLSASVSRVKLSAKSIKDRVKVFYSEWGNSDATAEMAIWMAITLRRRLHIACMEMSLGHWSRPTGVNGSLQKCTWLIVGPGKIASRVMARLPGMGISRVLVWDDKLDRARFSEFLERANYMVPIKDRNTSTFEASVPGNTPACDCKVFATSNLKTVLRQADVVSLHVPAIKSRNGRTGTIEFFSEDYLTQMRRDAVLINVARAEVVHPNVHKQLFPDFQFKPAGFGSDVLEEYIEDVKAYKNSYETADGEKLGESKNIWAAFVSSMQNAGRRASKSSKAMCRVNFTNAMPFAAADVPDNEVLPNVFLSPHLAGATPDAEEAVADEVVSKIVDRLELRDAYDQVLAD